MWALRTERRVELRVETLESCKWARSIHHHIFVEVSSILGLSSQMNTVPIFKIPSRSLYAGASRTNEQTSECPNVPLQLDFNQESRLLYFFEIVWNGYFTFSTSTSSTKSKNPFLFASYQFRFRFLFPIQKIERLDMSNSTIVSRI